MHTLLARTSRLCRFQSVVGMVPVSLLSAAAGQQRGQVGRSVGAWLGADAKAGLAEPALKVRHQVKSPTPALYCPPPPRRGHSPARPMYDTLVQKIMRGSGPLRPQARHSIIFSAAVLLAASR